MAGTIYTPVTLWEDFKLDLPIEETYQEYEKGGLIYRKIKISGKRMIMRLCLRQRTLSLIIIQMK